MPKKPLQYPSDPNPLSGGAQTDAFLQCYWQSKPLVIRAAIPAAQLRSLANMNQLRRLATDDDVESRLIEHDGEHWQLEHGPFRADQLPPQQQDNWTLLIQGVDLHLDAARSLLDQFRFVPDSRIDDLMISIAGNGGGVGAHVDGYDVFLLQLAGRRQWRIGPPQAGRTMREDQPVKLLAQFKPTQTFELNRGDMLYLPPGWAHDGVAVGPCATASIGFRAPSRQQIIAAWLTDVADRLGQQAEADAPTWRDLGGNAAFAKRQIKNWRRHPAQIDLQTSERLAQWLSEWQDSSASINEFLGRYLSEPKANLWFKRPSASSRGAILRRASQSGLQLDRKTRLLWQHRQLFINGELACPESRPSRLLTQLLRRLADQRRLNAQDSKALLADPEGRELVTDWIAAGWLRGSKTSPPT